MNWETLRQEIEKLLWQEYKEPQEEGMSLNMEELSEKIIEQMKNNPIK